MWPYRILNRGESYQEKDTDSSKREDKQGELTWMEMKWMTEKDHKAILKQPESWGILNVLVLVIQCRMT